MNLPIRREKTLRILELKFDTVLLEGDWFIFIWCGSVMARVKMERLTIRQRSIFQSLKETRTMEYKEVTLKIPKEASEVIDVSMKLIEAIREAGADGFGVDDVPALMGAVMQVAGEVSDYSLIVDELKNDPEAAANLALVTGSKLLKALGLL